MISCPPARKWDEDCVVVTIDDDCLYTSTTLQQLIFFYLAGQRQAIVAFRGRRMGICRTGNKWSLVPYPPKGYWPFAKFGRYEHLILPTGTPCRAVFPTCYPQITISVFVSGPQAWEECFTDHPSSQVSACVMLPRTSPYIVLHSPLTQYAVCHIPLYAISSDLVL